MTTGLFIGRFQPFHLGHLSDVKNALKEADELIIVIGSSQASNTFENPFTFEERKGMIERVLKEEKISDVSIVPVPDTGNDKTWMEAVKKAVPSFDVSYTGNDWVERIFKEDKLKVKKVRMIPDIDSTTIREKMATNEEWQQMVPESVVQFLEGINGIERIKKLKKEKGH